VVVGCIVEHENKVLLCKRALQPCVGLWTLPAGYMELNESTAGAVHSRLWTVAITSTCFSPPSLLPCVYLVGAAHARGIVMIRW
jgi:hypothetical protein